MRTQVTAALAAVLLIAGASAHADTIISFQCADSHATGSLALTVNGAGYATTDTGTITIGSTTDRLALVDYSGHLNYGSGTLGSLTTFATGPATGNGTAYGPGGFITQYWAFGPVLNTNDGIHFAWNQLPSQDSSIPAGCMASGTLLWACVGHSTNLLGNLLDNAVGSNLNALFTNTQGGNYFGGLALAIVDGSNNVVGSYSLNRYSATGYASYTSFNGSNNLSTTYGDVATLSNVSSAPAPVPVPAAAWLLGSGVLALVGVSRRRA